MVPVIKNLVHSVVTPRSDTAISARENIFSSITQEDSNVQKDTADPNLVLDSNPNSNLIIQDQILDLDQSKINLAH